jgi:two-component sensor histidine kinase
MLKQRQSVKPSRKFEMKNIYAFMLLLCSSAFIGISEGSAQSYNDKPASYLKQKLSENTSVEDRVKLLLALSRSCLFRSGATPRDVDSAILLMNQANQLSVQIRYKAGLGNSMLMRALILNHQGKSDDGLKMAQHALDIFIKSKDEINQGEAYIIIGQHYKNSGEELDKKISYYKIALAIFNKSGNKFRAASVLRDLGDFATITRSSVDALKYLREALAIYQSIGYKDLQGIYDLIGLNLASMGDYINGLQYGLLAVKTAVLLGDSSLQLCTIYNRLAFTYYLSKNNKQAGIYWTKSLEIAKKYHDEESIQQVSYNLTNLLIKGNDPIPALAVIKTLDKTRTPGKIPEMDIDIAFMYMKIFIMLKRYDVAEKYLDQMAVSNAQLDGKSLFHEKFYAGRIFYYQHTGQFEKSYPFIFSHRNFCKQNNLASVAYDDDLFLFRADSALGRFNSAIKHYQRYKMVNDSIFDEKKTRQTALLQIQFETDKKDRDIQLQNKDIQLLRKKGQLQQARSIQEKIVRNVILISAVLLALLAIVLFSRYRLKLRSNLLLQKQQAEINNQNKSLKSLNEKQKTLLTEKEWLLREIHHRVKNNLQITMSLLNIQSSYMVNDYALEAIQNSQRRMQAMSLIHQKLYQSENLALIDMSLYIYELVNYLKESFQDVNNLAFRFKTPVLELDIAQAVPLGLILNEAITNAIKYAFPLDRAGVVTISFMEKESGFYTLTVADNGIGLPDSFDYESHDSLGMNLMRGLTEQLQGFFEVRNCNGTVITVEFAGVNLMEKELKLFEQEA